MTDLVSVPRPSILDRVKNWMGIGPWTSNPGPMTGPAALTDAGWIPYNWPINFGQVGWDPVSGGMNSVVYACIALYARTIAQLPGKHKRELENNGTEVITTSALARILKR